MTLEKRVKLLRRIVLFLTIQLGAQISVVTTVNPYFGVILALTALTWMFVVYKYFLRLCELLDKEV